MSRAGFLIRRLGYSSLRRYINQPGIGDTMAEENFETFVARERARLDSEREAIFTQQQELENKLTEINRELAAIDAYEMAKSGKAPARTAGTRARRTSSRRGSRREQLLQIVKA